MPKKAKNTPACQSCRKSKTRCEVLVSTGSELPLACHRCEVLSIDCSYRHSGAPILPQTPGFPTSLPRKRKRPDTEAPSKKHFWSFISPKGRNVDWSAPLLAIQQLATLTSAEFTYSEHVSSEFSLSTIMPDSRIDRLIDFFHVKYTPWLNFQPIRNSSNPLVDIACAAVAARHLDGVEGSQARLRLQTLARDSLAEMVFAPAPVDSLEAVQCLLILALWGPFSAASEPMDARQWPWDARAMISAAGRMASRMRLDHASAEYEDLFGRASLADIAKLSEAAERARLWVALTNVESMSFMGTQQPLTFSRRTPEDYVLTQFPEPFNENVDLRNVRLGLMARHFDLCAEGIELRLRQGTDKEEWKEGISYVLGRMRRGSRLLMPLSFVLPSDQQPYFHAIRILQHTARLLVLYHALWQARASLPDIAPGAPWHESFLPRGAILLGAWGRDLIETSESLLIALLELRLDILCTAPDALFDMSALAAGCLIGIKFLVWRNKEGDGGPRVLPGASNLLLVKAANRLAEAGAGCGHRALKCATLIREILARWEARGDSEGGMRTEADATEVRRRHPTPPAVDRSGGPVLHMQCEEPPLGPQVVESATLQLEEGLGQANDISGVLSDIMFLDSVMLGDDTVFWDSLAGDDQIGW